MLYRTNDVRCIFRNSKFLLLWSNNQYNVLIRQGGKSETSVLPKYEGSTREYEGVRRKYQGVRREYEEVRREYEGSTRGVRGSMGITEVSLFPPCD
jgi:hypothetical protein